MAKRLTVTEFEVPTQLVANKDGSIIKIQKAMQKKYGKDVYLRFEFDPIKLVGIKVERRE